MPARDPHNPQDKPTVRLNTVTDLIAAVPLMFGFQPVDSFVVFPLTPGKPYARINHPHDPAALLEMAASLGATYRRHPGARLVLLAYTDNHTHALDAITAMTAMLDGIADVVDALVVDLPTQDTSDDTSTGTGPAVGEWFRLSTGERGVMDPGDVARISAEFALVGRPAPRASRAEVAADLIATGPAAEDATRAIVEAIEVQAAVRIAEAGIVGQADFGQADSGEAAYEAEAAWIRRRVEVFVYDQEPLSVEDAARILHAIGDSLDLRDAAWMAITHDQAHAHVALWRDLVRRAPAAQRTPAAALLAFAAWVAGDGALSWVALDLTPTGDDGDYVYTLARLVAGCLTNAVNPETWGPQQ